MQRRAEKGFGFGVVILVDNVVVGLHHHFERIAQEHRRGGEILGLLQILGGPCCIREPSPRI